MKTSLKITALLLAALFPCAAFAEIFGANLPAPLNVENAAMLFSMLLIGFTVRFLTQLRPLRREQRRNPSPRRLTPIQRTS